MLRRGHLGTAAVCGLAALLFFPSPFLHAEPAYVAVVRDYVEKVVKPKIADPAVLAAIEAQNARNADIAEADLRVLDATYRSEMEAGEPKMARAFLSNPVSQYLKRVQDESQGAISEILVTDRHGLNVAASTATFDYWQGDEDKFIKTFDAGDGGIFVDRAERDEATQSLEAQASFVMTDRTGRPVGIATVTIALEAL